MEELIEFLRREFPDDAMEIQECIDLLNQSISGCVESIKEAFNKAVDDRDFDKLKKLPDLLSVIDDIQNKLDYYSSMLQLDEETEDKILQIDFFEVDKKEIPDYDSLKVDSNIPYTLYDSYTHKRPAGFELFGERYDAKDWKDVLVKTCEVLASKDIRLFNSFVEDKKMNGKKVQYFCSEPNKIRAPRKVEGTNVYIMTNMSANQVRNTIEKMLRKYKIKINDYKIYLRADYTARHE